MLKGFLRKHKRHLGWLLVAYALLMLLMILLASGPQTEPFVYQLF